MFFVLMLIVFLLISFLYKLEVFKKFLKKFIINKNKIFFILYFNFKFF